MDDTKAFLRRLGSPDKGFKIIHVAGTNGKGSVCAYLRYVLEEAGYGVCAFTSPHLVDVRERFLIRGEMVSKEEFLKAFLEVYDMIPWEMLSKEEEFNEEGKLPEGFYHPTFFEYLFFMAMLLFRDAKPDYVILETGLGGRLDATNSVSRKELSVITRISLDHMEYLGDTTEKIAGEKAGIIAKDAPVIYFDDDKKISAVFDKTAEKIGAKACPVSKKDYALVKFQNKNIDFSLSTSYYNDINVTLHTAALYQMENAALAVRAIEELDQGRTISADQIRDGLAKTFWPGRMEEVLPNVFVDGAHNEDGVRAFLESVRADGWQGERILVFSAVKDKQYEKMLGEILDSGLFAELYLVPIHSGRATKVET
ncbi:MAG: bifunctional folylpolyglutamate synthase/dihydrofolate synthase, partial [Lachnospiraceae bacterium]|nr:bifunctional folylpolyglutamate synthase/dihydrofolate synthase [Lachnospiraceae bacterium]